MTVAAVEKSAATRGPGRLAKGDSRVTPERKHLPVIVVIGGILTLIFIGACATVSTHGPNEVWITVADRPGLNLEFTGGRPPQPPSLEKLTLVVGAVPSHEKLGVGVRLMAGNFAASDVHLDGKPVPVQVSVIDAQGKEVASKKGLLSDFGFS